MTVIVLMPTGVAESFRFRTVDEGHTLEIAVKLPLPMQNVKELFKPIAAEMGKKLSALIKCKDGHDHILKEAAFRKVFEDVCNFKDNWMLVKTKIQLPKQSTGETKELLLTSRVHSHVLMVDLWVYKKDCAKVKFGGGVKCC